MRVNNIHNLHHHRPSNKNNEHYGQNDIEIKRGHINCSSVTWCQSLHRLIDGLKFWSDSYSSNELIMSYLKGKNCKYILNDYHHIITYHLLDKSAFHLNYEFELIYNEVIKYMKPCTNLKNCQIFQRNRRSTRETEIQFDTELGFYIDIMDMIHCYFMHSYDIGMRRKCNHIFMEQERLTERLTNRSITTNKAMSCLTTSPAKSVKTELDDVTEEAMDFMQNMETMEVTDDNNMTFIRERGLGQIEEEDSEDLKYEDMSYELTIKQIKDNIKENRGRITNHDISRGKNNKYYTDISDTHTHKNAIFGYRYYYWDYYRESMKEDNGPNIGYKQKDWYIHCKYKDLKEEILNNQILRLNVSKYGDALYKVQRLMETDHVKGFKSNNYGEFNAIFHIESGRAMSVDHLMSIVLYTDYHELSHYFSETSRRIRKKETNDEIKLRNREYWHWSKLLIESVQLYGVSISDSKTETFFHSISQKSSFNEFECFLCGPTSTSPFDKVVEQFMSDNDEGILLELEKENEFSSLKVFNCASLSFYPCEDERLFIFGDKPLKFYNLIMLSPEYDNFRWFIRAINMFDACLNGKRIKHEINSNKNIEDDDYQIIYNLMAHYDAMNKYENNLPKYINHLFSKFVENKTKIILDLDIINDCYHGLIKYLIHSYPASNNDNYNNHNLIKIDYLSSNIFKNVEEIVIYNTKNINFNYSKSMIFMLSQLNQNRIKSLKKVKICNVTFNDQILNEFIISKKLQLKSKFRINAYCDIKIDTKYRIQYDNIKQTYMKIPEYSHLIIIRDFQSYEESTVHEQSQTITSTMDTDSIQIRTPNKSKLKPNKLLCHTYNDTVANNKHKRNRSVPLLRPKSARLVRKNNTSNTSITSITSSSSPFKNANINPKPKPKIRRLTPKSFETINTYNKININTTTNSNSNLTQALKRGKIKRMSTMNTMTTEASDTHNDLKRKLFERKRSRSTGNPKPANKLNNIHRNDTNESVVSDTFTRNQSYRL